jgi:glutathione synthase/RimK-type ligase-like ATP-grasp enzyme
MKRCAFLTLADPSGFVIDDELAHAPFRSLGWHVTAVPWTQTRVPWSGFDAVLIRSTWDYHRDPERFLGVLEDIGRAGVPLFNSLALVRWNLSKTYLHDLSARGVPTVPTLSRPALGHRDVEALFDQLGDELVLKPVVGANAEGAYRLRRDTWRAGAADVESYYARRALLAQPFARAVLDEGEHSLFYFDGSYSHGVLKTPAPGDFRVQEEHGARIRAVTPSAALLAAGDAVVATLPEVPLYARLDLVRSNSGDGFWIMELELVEPSMYLRMDPGAPRRFAEAFCRRVARPTIADARRSPE